MKKCINCGVELENSALFCEECGTKQPNQVKTCNQCGTEIQADEAFCPECGAPVGNNSAPLSPAQTIAQPVTIEDIDIAQPDKQTIAITVNGVIFNLKLVEGCEYVTPNEILDFYMGETPVTQALWMILMGDNPSKDNTNLLYPVTNIDQSLATSLLVKLRKVTGVKFEFPTKAQWEYAYKGGNRSKGYKYAGSDNVSEVGWVDGKLHQVGELFANEIGLCDMDGNVDELLKDGEWASRYSDKKKNTNNDFAGIRLVVNIPVDETIESQTPLQAILAEQQTKLIAAQKEIIQERQKKAEEESKRKAEEEAKRKAEEAEKARIKAEEDAARLKAQEEAKIKAEEEAKRKAEEDAIKAEENARIQAEEDARLEAENKAREAEIQKQINLIQDEQAEIESGLKNAKDLCSEKVRMIQTLENTIQESEQKIADTEKEIAAFNRRYHVTLMQRVDNGLFNSKGTLFDNMLMGLTGATKEQIKSWDQELKRTHRVTIGAQLTQSDAFGWKSAIEQAGGQAIVENPYEESEADRKMNGYKSVLDSANQTLQSAKESLPMVRKEAEQANENYQKLLEKKYQIVLRLKKYGRPQNFEDIFVAIAHEVVKAQSLQVISSYDLGLNETYQIRKRLEDMGITKDGEVQVHDLSSLESLI